MFARWIEKEYEIDEFEKIRVVHLKQYIAHQLKMGHKAAYVNNMIKILRAFFSIRTEKIIRILLITKVAWGKEEKPVIKTFSEQDARQLLEYYDNKSYVSCRNRTIITMLFETGIRCKELLDMQPEGIKKKHPYSRQKPQREIGFPYAVYKQMCDF